VLETDAKTGLGINQFSATIQTVLREQIEKWREKGQVGRPVRAMVVGVPNVGKSTFINKVARKKSAKASDRPGVTRGKQWVNVDKSLDLLDTPGILWPKFEDETTGLHLAFTGAVKDEIMDVETLGCHLMALMGDRYPEALKTGYKLSDLPGRETEENDVAYGYRLLECCAQKRGMRISGGELDTERMARVLLDEYRAGKLGRFTLEVPVEE
jgi:ribosome biogenesis GTPase A